MIPNLSRAVRFESAATLAPQPFQWSLYIKPTHTRLHEPRCFHATLQCGEYPWTLNKPQYIQKVNPHTFPHECVQMFSTVPVFYTEVAVCTSIGRNVKLVLFACLLPALYSLLRLLARCCSSQGCEAVRLESYRSQIPKSPFELTTVAST
jgi:hypothetical protein